MKKNIQILVAILLPAFVLVIFCSNDKLQETEVKSTVIAHDEESECIPSFNPLGIIPKGADIDDINESQIPPKNWENVVELTDAYSIDNFAIWDESEIWISYFDNGPVTFNKLLRYELEEDEKEFYSSDPNIYLPGKLFFSEDGTLWFVNNRNQNEVDIPFLSKFDHKTDSFQFVLDENGVMQPPNKLSSIPIEDYQGKFWFTIEEPGSDSELLLMFDPETLGIKESNVQILNSKTNIFLSSDKKVIWVVDRKNDKLTKYNILTKEQTTFNTLPKKFPDAMTIDLSEYISNLGRFYLDHSERLWFSNSGWIDFSNPDYPAFYELLPSPVFLRYEKGLENPIIESMVLEIMESSDGYIWFSTIDGVNRLDIRDDMASWNWCKVTNGYSQVVEDQQQNLWMIVFNEIYKLDISE